MSEAWHGSERGPKRLVAARVIPGQPVLDFAEGAFGPSVLASAENARLGGRTGFPEAWGNGRIAWLVVDVEQPENEHFSGAS